MLNEKKPEAKPLSFNTTMRNPYRIAAYLECLLPFEGKVLNHAIIYSILESAIMNKVYCPNYIKRIASLNTIYNDETKKFTKEQSRIIMNNSPQNHKEAGFDTGWESRFATIFDLPMEMGYIYFQKNEPLEISETGHMLIEAIRKQPCNTHMIENLFLNSQIKYQTNNPFRKNSNSNIPIILLLKVIKLLQKSSSGNNPGIYIQEVSLFLCWPNDNAVSLYELIKQIRFNKHFTYSNEYMYDICLKILHAESRTKRFKIGQICGEIVDEYIRKMRSTGLITLRGRGRFLDIDKNYNKIVDYILAHYESTNAYKTKRQYYDYMSKIDPCIVSMTSIIPTLGINEIRKKALVKYASEYSNQTIINELNLLAGPKIKASTDPLFRLIAAPTRLEFLTSIALVQHYKDLDVNPNYSCDDEGAPKDTAAGGMADIVCHDSNGYDSIIEVTLLRGRNDQINNEILPIDRHLCELTQNKEKTFAIFIAPILHEDTKKSAKNLWILHYIKDKRDIDVRPYTINDFTELIKGSNKLSDFKPVVDWQNIIKAMASAGLL